MQINFSYNNIDFSKLLTVTNITRDLIPPRENKFKNGKSNGSRLYESRLSHSTITIEFVLISKDGMAELRRKVAQLLNYNEPKKLIINDEPHKYYLAIIDGAINIQGESYSEKGAITFIIPDGVAHSDTIKQASRTRNVLTFNNEGTTDCYPIFEFTPQHDLRMFALVHPNGNAIQIGSENGPVVFKANKKVKIDTFKKELTIGGTVKYVNPASRWFSLIPGTTEIIYEVNRNGTLPLVVSEFEERWL